MVLGLARVVGTMVLALVLTRVVYRRTSSYGMRDTGALHVPSDPDGVSWERPRSRFEADVSAPICRTAAEWHCIPRCVRRHHAWPGLQTTAGSVSSSVLRTPVCGVLLATFLITLCHGAFSGRVVSADCVERIIKKDMVDPISGEPLKPSDLIPLQQGASSFAGSGKALMAESSTAALSVT